MFAFEVGEDGRVCFLQIFSTTLILLKGNMAYLSVSDKLLIDAIGLHPLADKIGDSAEEGIHRGYFAVPGKEGRDAFSIDAGGFGAAVGVYAIISCDP
jgi:hypothetical protein